MVILKTGPQSSGFLKHELTMVPCVKPLCHILLLSAACCTLTDVLISTSSTELHCKTLLSHSPYSAETLEKLQLAVSEWGKQKAAAVLTEIWCVSQFLLFQLSVTTLRVIIQFRPIESLFLSSSASSGSEMMSKAHCLIVLLFLNGKPGLLNKAHVLGFSLRVSVLKIQLIKFGVTYAAKWQPAVAFFLFLSFFLRNCCLVVTSEEVTQGKDTRQVKCIELVGSDTNS